MITTKLFPHQQQALYWMVQKENSKDLALFWKKVSKNSWFNPTTNQSTHVRPEAVKGGVLADDMGLGKTLVVISLILTNHLNGQPMFSKRIDSPKVGVCCVCVKCTD